MKNIGRIVWVSVILLVMASIFAFASGIVPGSEQDPVVTLSYVNAQIDQLKAYIDSKISSTGDSQSKDQEASQGAVISSYEILNLSGGQSLIGKESTEIILRSGEATAIGNGANGISDLTAGKDLLTGDVIGQNHLLLVPRDDGRGIKAVTDIWVMVKGAYEIK